jgi:TctA family transporter
VDNHNGETSSQQVHMDFNAAFQSLLTIVTSTHLMGLILLAIPIGMFFGAVPGLGGKLGIVLLIPFVFGMDPMAGAVFLLAMHAVVHTGGSVPSILFGVPGTGPDAATIVDGYPMAQRGEAGRALGASLGASGLGGVIGALFLAAMLPVLKPVVLAFSPAEFFLLALFGITFIAMLSGRSLIKGIAVGFLGLLVSLVGLDPHTGSQRFTFDHLFLWEGVSVVAAVLGIFAIPEMLSLGVKGGAIAEVKGKPARYDFKQVLEGIYDVFRHPWLAVRTSILGAAIGAIPGLGGDAASWLCYGHAVQTSKNPENFGKGDVRGIIAPETANNSKEGGSLLPTLFFGVPGSSGMAILIGAFVMLGIQPGPAMALTGMDLVWSLIWALAIANFLSVFVFLAMAPAFSLLVYVRGALLIPFVLVLAFLGAYLSDGSWENLLLLVGIGVLGFFLKKHGWPRPPFVIGLVLGAIAEDSIHKALAIWGPTFFLRPLSLFLIALIVLTILAYIVRLKKADKTKMVHHDI